MAFAAPIMAVVSLASTVIGTAVSYMGAQQQAKAQAQAAQYQAQVARNNSIMMQQNATYERQKTQVDAQNQDQKNKAQLGQIEAQQGASGFDLGSLSMTNVRSSASELGRLDTLTVGNNGERKARDFDVAATNQTAQAGMYDMEASNAKSAGQLNAYSSLLSGASSFSSRWASYSKSGVI
jgi:hypothetical protein